MTQPGDDYRRFATGLRRAQHDLRRNVSTELEREGRQIGDQALTRGVLKMPRSGGFADRLKRGARTKVDPVSAGSVVEVGVELRSTGGNLAALDRGELNHPVFNRQDWVTQRVPAGAFSAALRQQIDRVRAAGARGLQKTLDDVARKV